MHMSPKTKKNKKTILSRDINTITAPAPSRRASPSKNIIHEKISLMNNASLFGNSSKTSYFVGRR